MFTFSKISTLNRNELWFKASYTELADDIFNVAISLHVRIAHLFKGRQ